MTVREFLMNMTVILSVMALGALIEVAVPMFAASTWRRGRRGANLGLTAVSFMSNWILASIAAALALTLRPAGLLTRLGSPLWLDIAIGIVVLDFSVGYLSHRAMHMWPVMWRFHHIHHSDAFVDVTTTYRTHPIETIWRFLFVIVPELDELRDRHMFDAERVYRLEGCDREHESFVEIGSAAFVQAEARRRIG